MPTSPTVVVLGGGVGGVVAARELRKRLPARHRVVLIDREPEHLFAPSLLWLLVGQRRAEAIKRPLGRLGRKGIEVTQGEITAIDPEGRRVTVGGETITADHLVIALGAELAPEAVPGLSGAGHNFYTLPGAEGFRDALASLERGRVVILTAAQGYKCPAAPYEAALLIDDFLRQRGRREGVSVELYAAEPGPMGVAGPEVSGAVKGMLEARGIPYHPDHQVTAAEGGMKQLVFANGKRVDYDLLAYVPPHRAPKVVRECGLVGENGWVAVDRHTLETTHPGVYAIGDVVSIPLKLGRPLPKAGVFAHGQAEVVARNIATAIEGRTGAERYMGRGGCFIEVGGGRAGYGSGDFYAEPRPEVKLHQPSRYWHLGKVLFEQWWLRFKL